MPYFVPPTAPDQPNGYTSESSPSYKLFRYVPVHQAGQTVWLDQGDVWHAELYPYAGGEITRYYDDAADPKFTQTPPEPGLATAKVVYDGGHVHTISDAEALALIAGGFGAYITDAPPIPNPDPDPDTWPPNDLTGWDAGDGIVENEDSIDAGDGIVVNPNSFDAGDGT